MEAVANEAAVSKGGLLYHFATKQELVEALIGRLIELTDEDLARYDDGRPGGFTRAYIRSNVAALTTPGTNDRLRRWSVVLAAGTEPGLKSPMVDAYERWMSLDPEEPLPMRALIGRLAADGLWYNAQFSSAFHDPELLKQIEAELLAMVGDESTVDRDGDGLTAAT